MTGSRLWQTLTLDYDMGIDWAVCKFRIQKQKRRVKRAFFDGFVQGFNLLQPRPLVHRQVRQSRQFRQNHRRLALC